MNFSPVRQEKGLKYVYFELTNVFTADGNCILRVDTTRSNDTTSWYEIWEASVAIGVLCVRNGNRGIVSRFGTYLDSLQRFRILQRLSR